VYSNQAKTTFEPPLGCFERLQRWLGEKKQIFRKQFRTFAPQNPKNFGAPDQALVMRLF
jgi:hypothetical protein